MLGVLRRHDMADIEIKRELTPAKARYVDTFPGVDGEADLNFSRADEKLVIAQYPQDRVGLM